MPGRHLQWLHRQPHHGCLRRRSPGGRRRAAQTIDEASEDYGMKMDPFRMNDLVGLDFFGRERANSGAATPDTVVMDALYAAGRFGQKNGKGFTSTT